MLRKYSITIISGKNAPQIADNVQRHFNCWVSEPSSWVAAGSTDEKGLTFLDSDGDGLKSEIFKNQAYFNPGNTAGQPEDETIRSFIYAALMEHYRFEKTDIEVAVHLIK